MANDEEGREPEDLGQDPFVERMRPDPSQPPEAVRVLEGLMGDSDREDTGACTLLASWTTTRSFEPRM
jgi:hypothetical protein